MSEKDFKWISERVPRDGKFKFPEGVEDKVRRNVIRFRGLTIF